MLEHLSLVKPVVCVETVALLRYLVREAEGASINGIACTILRPGQDFTVYIKGRAKADPVFARGAVGSLVDHLARLVGSK